MEEQQNNELKEQPSSDVWDDEVTDGGDKNDADKKSEKRRKISNYEKHLRPCPHCGKDILDHFTECPHCGKAVDPKGYHANEEKLVRIKRITQIIGFILTIGLVAVILVVMFKKSDGKEYVAGREAVETVETVSEDCAPSYSDAFFDGL